MKTIALWMGALALWTVAGCGGDATTGHPVVLRTQIEADSEIAGDFVTATGWSVRLSKAALSLGSLYYFDGEPAFVSRAARPSWKRIALSPFVSIARAHPGHYIAGMALGQVTAPGFADLLAGTTMLPEGSGITGTYRSARVVLAQPTAEPALSRLGSHVAEVEGIASKGQRTVHFRVSADFSEVARSVTNGQVDGCAFELAEVDEDGVVTLSVRPHVWLNLVDFTAVAPGSAEAPTEIAHGETAQVAFALGLVQLSAYQFRYDP